MGISTNSSLALMVYDIPIIKIINNKNLHALIKSDKFLQDKRLRVDIAAIKEMIKTKYC